MSEFDWTILPLFITHCFMAGFQFKFPRQLFAVPEFEPLGLFAAL